MPSNKDKAASKDAITGLMVREKFEPHLYNDRTSPTKGAKEKGNCTVGYGQLVHYGVCDGTDPSEKPFSDGIEKKEALKHLMKGVAAAESSIRRNVKVELNQNQFDALVSFIYNAGSPTFARSTLLKKVNAGKMDEVPSEMAKYVYSGKKRMQGLVNRREEEGARFAEPDSAAAKSVPAPTLP